MAQPPSEARSPSERRPDQASPSGRQGQGRVRIKGTRKGLAITLDEGDWQELLRELDNRLGQAVRFFAGSQVNLRCGRGDISQQDLQEVLAVLARHNVELASLETRSRLVAEAAQALGIRLALPEAPAAPLEPRTPPEEWSEGVLVHRTVRSGQSIRHPGHVVIVGDVNPGAEIIAGGDVVVWGRLLGVVQAGALDNNQAIICALELRPTQLRIGTYIAKSPDDSRRKRVQPEVASVLDGQIVAQPWTSR